MALRYKGTGSLGGLSELVHPRMWQECPWLKLILSLARVTHRWLGWLLKDWSFYTYPVSKQVLLVSLIGILKKFMLFWYLHLPIVKEPGAWEGTSTWIVCLSLFPVWLWLVCRDLSSAGCFCRLPVERVHLVGSVEFPQLRDIVSDLSTVNIRDLGS